MRDQSAISRHWSSSSVVSGLYSSLMPLGGRNWPAAAVRELPSCSVVQRWHHRTRTRNRVMAEAHLARQKVGNNTRTWLRRAQKTVAKQKMITQQKHPDLWQFGCLPPLALYSLVTPRYTRIKQQRCLSQQRRQSLWKRHLIRVVTNWHLPCIYPVAYYGNVPWRTGSQWRNFLEYQKSSLKDAALS